jgi:ribosomal protein L28
MRQCSICGKKCKWVWRRVRLRATKYNPTVKRKQYPNLQWVFIPPEIKKEKYKEWAGKRVLACTKCIKAMAKRK